MTDHQDRELRAVLHDAVADVEPTRTPDDLHARLARQPRRAWVPLTLAAAVATALVLVGVPWLVDRDAEAPPAAAPSEAASPAADDTPPPDTAADPPAESSPTVTAYAVVLGAPGPRLVADVRESEGAEDPVTAAVQETVTGSPSDPDYEPAWPETSVVVDSRTEPGRIQVDLSTDWAGYRGDDSSSRNLLAVQAVVWAATQAAEDPDADVVLTFNGHSYEALGEVPTAQPLRRETGSTVPAAVLLDSLGEGATVSSPFTVSGLASAFEATVTWRLLDGQEVVREGFATAAECCTPSPYSFEVEAPPGDYVLEVGETDPSDGEGFPPYLDTKTITVR